jgi:hypothetical protein
MVYLLRAFHPISHLHPNLLPSSTRVFRRARYRPFYLTVYYRSPLDFAMAGFWRREPEQGSSFSLHLRLMGVLRALSMNTLFSCIASVDNEHVCAFKCVQNGWTRDF